MLGLNRGGVKLTKSVHKVWAQLFEQEKKLLTKTFGDRIIAVEHIGSTSVPKLIAKPVLDFDIGVKSLAVARGMKRGFAKLGYEHRPFVPKTQNKVRIKGQEIYAKGPVEKRTHYAHVMVYNGKKWKDDLLFRDYLRSHEGARKQYATLKRNLAVLHENDRMAYTTGKEKFILNIVQHAKKRHTRNQAK